ncbi:MAG: hypothetical protein FJ126_13745 [Deltaproteobacteria bacterium]|nr:hypothetical protein [Deltaproteobacteria bacterium]
MIDEHGCAPTYHEENAPLVAVFAHPLHGRLVERVILMASNRIQFQDRWYSFSWKENGTAYYQPVEYCEPEQPACRCS